MPFRALASERGLLAAGVLALAQACASRETAPRELVGSPVTFADDAGQLPILRPEIPGLVELADAGSYGPQPSDAGEAMAAPILAPDGVCSWIDFPDAYCRDGSTTGIAARLNPASKNLVIYLEGGGACFDPITCAANNGNVAQLKGEKTQGIFDRTQLENPVRDWNLVYVPYCTGDVHGGTKAMSVVPGFPGTQKFVGHLNIQAFLKRIVPTFFDAEQVLLTGVSAGGFGAAINTLVVQRAFPWVDVMLIDDSGPPLSSKYLTPCLQQKWRDLWGLDLSMLMECGPDCPSRDDFVFDFARRASLVYENRTSGLIESAEDGTISGFFGAGQYNCLTVPFVTPLSGSTFREGVLAFRSAMADRPNFGTYLPPGTQHTWIAGDSFYSGSIGDVRLVDWFRDIVEGTRAAHVGP